MERDGLLIIYTGPGKGKTTAALGQVLRAAGQGLKVCVIQFIKGQWPTGESKSIKYLPGDVEFYTVGSGFTWQVDAQETKRAAEMGWKLAEEKIMAGGFDLVVLDELTYVLNYDLVAEEKIVQFLKGRPPQVHVVVTGRDAKQSLVDLADLVTEMQCIKHPYKNGVKAQKGIEF